MTCERCMPPFLHGTYMERGSPLYKLVKIHLLSPRGPQWAPRQGSWAFLTKMLAIPSSQQKGENFLWLIFFNQQHLALRAWYLIAMQTVLPCLKSIFGQASSSFIHSAIYPQKCEVKRSTLQILTAPRNDLSNTVLCLGPWTNLSPLRQSDCYQQERGCSCAFCCSSTSWNLAHEMLGPWAVPGKRASVVK